MTAGGIVRHSVAVSVGYALACLSAALVMLGSVQVQRVWQGLAVDGKALSLANIAAAAAFVGMFALVPVVVVRIGLATFRVRWALEFAFWGGVVGFGWGLLLSANDAVFVLTFAGAGAVGGLVYRLAERGLLAFLRRNLPERDGCA